MITIDSTTLDACIIRGDTGTINLTNNIRNFEIGDIIYLTVKKALTDLAEDIVLQKEVTSFNVDGTATIILDPEDTIDIEPAIYFYDITWVDDEDNTHTLINGCEIPHFTIKRGSTNG